MSVLTGIDTLGVQRFIFASNRLRDIVSASWLVDRATSENGLLGESGAKKVLLAAGGNAILEFADLESARSFTTRYTRHIYDEAPGLEVVVAHHTFEEGGLARALQELAVDLARAKLERLPSTPLLGCSVTQPCAITGLPAVGFDPQNRGVALSRSILALRQGKIRRLARERWQRFLPDGGAEFAFPDEIDEMGRSRGEKSLIGVVHIDGNGVGERIRQWLRECIDDSRSDDTVRAQYTSWSKALHARMTQSLVAIVERVGSAVSAGPRRRIGHIERVSFGLSREASGRALLPLRPILLGGDDLSFICDGRLALDLAAAALRSFQGAVPKLGELSACAGIAIVPSHAPFDRAHEAAVALCHSAKICRQQNDDGGSWMDWHVGSLRPGESIDELRKRQYHQAETINLSCRPYPLGANGNESKTWSWLAETVLGEAEDGLRGPLWSERRSKVKALRELVREGPDAVKEAMEVWRGVTPGLCLPEAISPSGFFVDRRTPLLDALELLDLHLPLDGGVS